MKNFVSASQIRNKKSNSKDFKGIQKKIEMNKNILGYGIKVFKINLSNSKVNPEHCGSYINV